MPGTRAPHPLQRGLSLVELMVALAIGMVIVAGALTVQQRCSAALRTLETVARLQEVARLALDVLETDVRMANYWGLNNHAEYVVNRGQPAAALPAPFSATQGARIDLCGGNGSHWAIRLDEYLDGSNDSYGLTCAAVGTASHASDTLVVRRAVDVATSTLAANRIHLQTTRTTGALFVATSGCTSPRNAACLPPAFDPAASQTRELVVHAYYVSMGGSLRPDLPALRRKSFGNVNAAAASDAISDEELAPGVEDLQVRLGIDTSRDGNVDEYVDPGAVPAGAAVVSATLWLRVRSEEREPGHVDRTAYRYGSMTADWVPNDEYRRIVVAKTVQVRNARP
jgi:type IV pilus assembly protein PilW